MSLTSKLKIAFYSHSLPPEVDGVSTRFSGILNSFDKLGYECVIFTLRNDVLKESNNFKYISLDYSTTKAYSDKRFGSPYFNNFWKIYNELREFKPDIIHCVSDGTTSLFMLIGIILQIPVAVGIHTDVVSYFNKFNFPAWFEFLANWKDIIESCYVDEVGTTSESFKLKLTERGIDVKKVFKSGVDTNLFNKNKYDDTLRSKLMFGNNNKNNLLCTFVGRFSHEKSIFELVEWVSKIDNIYLALIGDGPIADDLKKLHGKENRIYCQPKFVSKEFVSKIFASSDIHVSASTTETLGNTVLEAHACNIPVIVPNAAGFKNTVTSYSDGYLYDSNDDAINVLKHLQNNRETIQLWGQNGNNKVQQHSIDAAAKDYLKWYQHVINHKKRKGYLFLIRAIIHLIINLIAWVLFFTIAGKSGIIQAQTGASCNNNNNDTNNNKSNNENDINKENININNNNDNNRKKQIIN